MLSRTLSIAVLSTIGLCAHAQQEYSITHLAGDVYMFSGGGQNTFMVTPEGAVVADPLSAEAAGWLKAEIRDRFGLPVTYVLYSHFHWDHVSGGAVYDDAIVIAHENTARNLAGPAPDEPLNQSRDYYDGRFAYYDAQGNDDGVLQFDELAARYVGLLGDADLDGDGVLSYYEVHQGQHRDVRPPDETFDSEVHRLEVGGKTVEMHYIYNGHSDDMSFIHYPEERVLMVVDIISLRRLPWFNMGSYNPEEAEEAVELAFSLAPDIVVPGHGDVGNTKDLADFYSYLQALKAGVAAGIAAGHSVDEIKANLLLDDYSQWGAFSNWRPTNIEGMYAYLTRE